MEILKSKNNQQIKELAKLKLKKYRQEQRVFLIEGYHLVEEAKKHNLVMETYEYFENPKYKDSILVSEDIIKYLSTTKTPQKIIAKAKFKDHHNNFNRVVILNKLQDPGNVGTIFRLAKSFNFDTVLVQDFDFYNEKTIRASQGAFFDLNIIKIQNLGEEIKKLQNENFQIHATLLDQSAHKLEEVAFRSDKLAIIFGNEGNGIEPEIAQMVNSKVYIPINFESLNVACAASIVLYQARKG
ncbi:TrmH family RNA methyltransferase [Mycoplasmopsis sturni]|uniref:TrmH family RNA methyltransferase n=1 Tax=Mycoplasmopsis sturni TaxID=39047 RepID=UPI00056C94DA|nr:RNA methyltransferase [Mycoplasmopsis sturni]